jgi:hypothetical protein
MRSRLAALIAVCVVAGIVAVPVLAGQWYLGPIVHQTTVHGAFNYWYGTDTSKDSGLEHLGFEHSDGTSASIAGTGTYLYTDTSRLGFGGYIRPFIANNTTSNLYNIGNVCTC